MELTTPFRYYFFKCEGYQHAGTDLSVFTAYVGRGL